MGLIRKTVILAGYACNNRCVFCMEALKRDLPVKSTKEILRDIALARGRGSAYLELIGGESTIRDDIFRLIRFARSIGFDTVMMSTNGRMFSYPHFAENIIDAGLTDAVFSIHGHTAALHDSLTRADGSFNQLIEGISRLRKLDFNRIGSNTTIVKPNARFLPQIGKLLLKLGIKNSEFIFVDPNEGGAKENFKALVPKISQAAPYMRRLLELGRQHGIKSWTVRYVPMCYFRGYEDQISELREVETFHTEHIAPDFTNYDVSGSRRVAGRIRTERCKPCVLKNKCEGIWKTYAALYGDKELKPI